MKGTVLGNRYELLEKIGEGGMSEVYKARCNKLNRFVAVKILKKEFCNNDEIVEKFKNEAKSIATLSDNNIVNVLDVGTQEELHYIVMEYVKGKTLKDVIKQVGKMNYETAISIALQIAKALDCAHRNNIIHRDVKPQNILVTEDGIMKVSDFGIAKSASSATITNTTTIMGSAHYLSPEQAKGSFIDCRTDLYSLGIVIYEMVTGVLPFEADSPVTIALKHIQEQAIEPKKINSKIPDSLNLLIMKAIEKDPNKRYQSAKELGGDLQKIKDNPNAVIDNISNDDNQQTIIMSAADVTEQIKSPKVTNNNYSQQNSNNYDEDEEDDDEYYDDDEEEEFISRKRKKTILGIILSAVGIMFLIGIGVIGVNFLSSNTSVGTEEVAIPNIVGMSKEKAKDELESRNLVYVEVDEEASDEPEGTVLKTNPKEGTMVKEKSEVRVVVSSGTKSLKMPDIEQYSLDKAKTILKSLNLNNITTIEQYSDTVEKGCVISQDPKPESHISEDERITLVISLGPQIKFVTVENVVGKLSEEGKAILSNSGLRVDVQTSETLNVQEDGVILSQSISGSKVEQGTKVTIHVGKYNKQNEAINVTPDNNNKNNEESNIESSDGDDKTDDKEQENMPEGPWADPELNQE